MNNHFENAITGTTSEGVPYLLRPPIGGSSNAPLVVAWHLLDPPRTETAFAAALPLDGLEAWRLYLGLPMSGGRMPAGGPEAFYGMLASDAPGLVHGPIHEGAVREAPVAIAEVRERAGMSDSVSIGLLGGSMGGAVVAELVASGTVDARASVLLNPLLELRMMIDAVSPAFGGYTWTPAGSAAAARIDYVHRAAEFTHGSSIRVVSGDADAPFFVASAQSFAEAIGADLQVVSGAAHALADEPGVAPAPQNDTARAFDELTVAWFRKHLN